MELARELKQPSVRAMLRSMSIREFRDWVKYAELEPFDGSRDDYRFASIVSAILNVHRNPKKRRRPYTLEDVKLLFGDSKKIRKKQTWQEQLMIAKMYAAAFSQKPTPKRNRKQHP